LSVAKWPSIKEGILGDTTPFFGNCIIELSLLSGLSIEAYSQKKSVAPYRAKLSHISLLDTARDWKTQCDFYTNPACFPPHICITTGRPDIVVWSDIAKIVYLQRKTSQVPRLAKPPDTPNSNNKLWILVGFAEFLLSKLAREGLLANR
jgi:hypothetical protein